MVVRDPTLARIELAYLAFNMAEFATWIAILVYAYDLGGAGAATLAAVVQLIPAGFVAPLVASAVDRYRRDHVLVVGYLCQAAAFGATAASMYAGAPVFVTVAFAVVAACSITVTRPVQGVILPALTHSPADLTAANAVAGLAENVGIFVGPFVGGVLLGRAQPGDVFAAFAIVLLVAGALVARLPADFIEARPMAGAGWRTVLGGTFEGIGVLRDAPRPRLLVVILGGTVVVLGALDLLVVATAIDFLGVGQAWAGFLYAAFGFGGIVGSLAAVGLIGRRRMTPALAGGGALYGLPISTTGLVPIPSGAALLFGIAGAGYSVAAVAGRTLLQRVAPEAALARVFGVLESLTMFAFAAGTAFTGAVIALVGVSGALVAVGLIVPTLILLAWTSLSAIDRDARPIDAAALELLRRLPIFAPLSAPSMERILVEIERADLPSGTEVIREGDPGDRFYVVADGRFDVSVRGTKISEGATGDYFGEIALLRDVPRTATVTAVTPLSLIVIERERFLEAVTGHPRSHAQAESVAAERVATAQR